MKQGQAKQRLAIFIYTTHLGLDKLFAALNLVLAAQQRVALVVDLADNVLHQARPALRALLLALLCAESQKKKKKKKDDESKK